MLNREPEWMAPETWLRIRTFDAHTAGEPLRVIYAGFPEPEGRTVLEKRRFVQQHLDHLRRALMWEPRGHADMYGCILTEAERPDSHFGVIFTHNEGYSTMCGHGIIAVTRVVLETGMLPAEEPQTEVRIDTPAGQVCAFARIRDGQVKSIFFRNVPSFVVALDQEVDVPGIGRVHYDLAFGGAFYAFVDAESLGLKLNASDARVLIDTGMAIKRAVAAQRKIRHPTEADLSFLYGTIFTGPAENPQHHSRNVCIFAEGEVDRSPTGTGVSARLAIHFTRGEIRAGESLVIESILGTTFTGTVVEKTSFAGIPAVIPQVEGTAHLTGHHEFYLDPEDPLRYGFFIR